MTMTYADLMKHAKAGLRHCKNRGRLELELELVCGLMGGSSKPIATTTRTDLDALVSQLEARKGRKGKHLNPATINRYMASLSGAFKWAVERPELFGQLPALKWPRLPESPAEKPVITQTDEDRLYAYLSAHKPAVALAFAVMIETGMRVGEFCKITSEDLWGDCWVTLRDTKNGDTRDVDLSPDLWEGLGRLLTRRELPTYAIIKKAVYAARKALRLNPRLTVHCFRHTVATRLSEAGESDTNAMRLLGHRSVITFQRYSKRSHSATRATTAKLRGTRRYIINDTPEKAEASQGLGAQGRNRTTDTAIFSREPLDH